MARNKCKPKTRRVLLSIPRVTFVAETIRVSTPKIYLKRCNLHGIFSLLSNGSYRRERVPVGAPISNSGILYPIIGIHLNGQPSLQRQQCLTGANFENTLPMTRGFIGSACN